MVYILNNLDSKLSRLQHSKDDYTKFKNMENLLQSINHRLSSSDTLIILGDVTCVKYLPKYFDCTVSIVIARKSLTDYYSSRWEYLQQGYKHVYDIHKFYIYDSKELVI